MRLKKIRMSKELSVPALSRLSGLSVRTIEEVERRNTCSIKTAKKLAVSLAVTLDELCADEEDTAL